eukprot:TRINITY_DN76096_c0_g1_i1.p1 TRINITY_DN76096_c0_g1~~TRINITY_DN76096_c0_g1_i1.p1  ORF type:complete len:293 (+),score=25.52 TRINITY_DN76096_c0_g1_i1:125-880(+)
MDLDDLSYHAITWVFVFVKSSISFHGETHGIFVGGVWSVFEGIISAFTSTCSDAYQMECLGTTLCLGYFAIHIVALATMQDQNSWLPFSSFDMFSEAITLFDHSLGITLVCFPPSENASESHSIADILRPHPWMLAAKVFENPKLIEKVTSQRCLVFSVEASTTSVVDDQQNLRTQLLSMKDVGIGARELTIYSNVEISSTLRKSCQAVVDVLRRHVPGDEWDPETMEQVLGTRDDVLKQLQECAAVANTN